MEEKNFLFITADQWRAECLSILGHPTVKTPNLDALAADGVLFRNHRVVRVGHQSLPGCIYKIIARWKTGHHLMHVTLISRWNSENLVINLLLWDTPILRQTHAYIHLRIQD